MMITKSIQMFPVPRKRKEVEVQCVAFLDAKIDAEMISQLENESTAICLVISLAIN